MTTKDVNVDVPDYLTEILEMSIPVIEHSVFKNKYLPLLLNKDPLVFNAAWINDVAGSHHARVKVVDSKGDSVFDTEEVAGSNPVVPLFSTDI